MDPPRTYLLSRRSRLRPGEDTMGVDVIERNCSIPMPAVDEEIFPKEEHKMTFWSTLVAILCNLATRQPGGFIMDKLQRVKAVANTIYQHRLSTLAASAIQLPPQRYFFGKDLLYLCTLIDPDPVWRNPRAGQWQIAYQDPSRYPRWRMKPIIEFVDERDTGRTFQISA